jgi:uncharacterized protein
MSISSLSDTPQAGRCLVAFDRGVLLQRGEWSAVMQAMVAHVKAQPEARVLVFDAVTSELLDVGAPPPAPTQDGADAVQPAPGESASSDLLVAPDADGVSRRGRPRLGVVAREVTLLPRHWDWLSIQPGGASVALRKLVEQARKVHADADRTRLAQAACYRFMSASAGHLPGFEEAARALFASDQAGLQVHMAHWPPDVEKYIMELASIALPASSDAIKNTTQKDAI